MRLDPRLAGIGAVLLVGLTLAGILLLGRLSYPDFPSVAEQPDPEVPGIVAFIRWDDGESCLHVVDAGAGQARRLRCDEFLSGPLTWSEDGLVQVTTHEGPQPGRILAVDPSTGRTVRTDDLGREPQRPVADVDGDGRRLRTESERGLVRLLVEGADGPVREVVRVEGPRDYHWWAPQWSPDGRYALVADSAQRLLVVEFDGGDVRILATAAGGDAAWGRARKARVSGNVAG
jgi:hypothetical protein